MMLAIALFMLPMTPADRPVDLNPPAAVVVASATKPMSALPSKELAPESAAQPLAPPDAPSTTLNEIHSVDAALVTAPTVISPALILNVATPAKKKSLAEQHPTAIKYWRGLAIAQSGAAAFDAWTTRRNISTGRFREDNPWLEPFAGNASLYAVMQVRPVLFDYVGRRMLRSDKKWVRNLWWVPQSAQTAANLWCGARNMSIR